jgi:hypothetical protein
MKLGDQFESINAAQEAITQYVLNNSKLYKTEKSDKKRFVICCKDKNCGFGIRAAKLSKEIVLITIFKLYLCSPTVYYNNWQSQFVRYLIEHH